MSVISPCVAGISKEFTTPSSAISKKIGQGFENPRSATKAISKITHALISAAIGRTRLRGNLSATAPPIGATMIPGALRAPNVAAESSTDSVCTSTSQPTASLSAHAPSATQFEPSHNTRYAGFENASNTRTGLTQVS